MTDEASCEWEGPFATLEMHVDVCEFVPITCPRQCKEKLVKKDLIEHLKKYCPYRAWECGLCGEAGRYSDIAQVHGQVCSMETLKCPIAGCTEVVQRQHIAKHLVTCEHGLVSCKYRNIGCEAKPKRMDVPKHEGENEEAHWCMALDKAVELQDSNSNLKSSTAHLACAVARVGGILQALKSSATELMRYSEEDMEALKVMLTFGNQESSMLGMQVRSLLYCVCKVYIFRMTNCQSYIESGGVFTSRPFYTVPGYRSYHMVIEVQLNGGADPNCISIHTALVDGKFDHDLSWPFVGEVGFLLVNQSNNSYHHYKALSIRAEDDMRVGSPPQGIADFVPHLELYHNPDDNFENPEEDGLNATATPEELRQYLKDDTLYFQVAINQSKSWLSCKLLWTGPTDQTIVDSNFCDFASILLPLLYTTALISVQSLQATEFFSFSTRTML